MLCTSITSIFLIQDIPISTLCTNDAVITDNTFTVVNGAADALTINNSVGLLTLDT